MHELSLCESIMQILRNEAAARAFSRVKVVRLEIGTFCCASVEALDFCFQVVSRDSLADGARLDVVRLPGTAWCTRCAEVVGVRAREEPCPRCGGVAVPTSGGDDMRIKDLEVD